MLTTLNYDCLFEKSTGRASVTWVDEDKHKLDKAIHERDAAATIIHLHGYFERASTVVLGSRSYYRFLNDAHAQMVLPTLLMSHTLLFIGCGGTFHDPNFTRLREWAKNALAHSTHKHFLLCRDNEISTIREQLRSAWLYPIGYGARYDDLTSFLRHLSSSLSSGQFGGRPDRFSWTSQYAKCLKSRFSFLQSEVLYPKLDQPRLVAAEVFVEQMVRSCDSPDRPPATTVEVIRTLPRVVILGNPGVGKSLLLQYLTLEWAHESNNVSSNPIPILIELKTYAANLSTNCCHDFLGFLDHGSGLAARIPQAELASLLLEGDDAVFLFDGLDEIVDSSMRQRVVHDIVRFATEHEGTRFVVTTRSVGHEPLCRPLRDAGFERFLIEGFDAVLQDKLIRRWHELSISDHAARKGKEHQLRSAIEKDQLLGELAQNPLMLTLMALINAAGNEGELLGDRNSIFERACHLFVEGWDETKGLPDEPQMGRLDFSADDKKSLLRAVAHRMLTSKDGQVANVITREDLEQTLVEQIPGRKLGNAHEKLRLARRLIQRLGGRDFMLCQRDEGTFSFVYPAFLDFFGAWAFAMRRDQKQMQLETFEKYWGDETWHEVLRLLAGRLDARHLAQVLRSLLKRSDKSGRQLNVFLAAKCLSAVRGRIALQDISQELEARLREIASPVVDSSPMNDEATKSTAEAVTLEAYRTLASVWQSRRATRDWMMNRARQSERPAERIAAILGLAEGWGGDCDVWDLLKRIGEEEDGDWFVRQTATLAVARSSVNGQETLSWLEKRAQADPDAPVRLAATQATEHGWSGHPLALQILKARTQGDADSDVRREAVRYMARAWRHETGVLLWLKAHAVSECEHWAVRYAAIEELARGWPNDAQVLTLLKDRLQHDPDLSVRHAAANELRRGWRGALDVIEALRNAEPLIVS